MGNKRLRAHDEYEQAIGRLRELMLLNPADDSAEADELELLGLLVQDYEDRTVPPFADIDAIDMLEFRMDQMGWTAADLIPIFGSQSSVEAVMERREPLTLEIVRRLHDELDFPADILIKETVTHRKSA